MKKIILALLIALSTVSGALFMKASTPDQTTTNSVGAVNFVGVLPTTLSGSGVNATVSSVGVTSMKISQTSQPLSMADFGSIGYATIEPGVPTRQEFISFTGITQNANGTAILTGVVRGLAPVSPYTASSTMRFPHGGATKIIISNSPPFYNNFALQTNNATVTAQWIFPSLYPVRYDTHPTFTIGTELVDKSYADGLSFAGVATSSESNGGLVWLGTALQQASSTNGGANQPFVMQTRYATDTPLSGCAVGYTSTAGAGCSVIATLAGKIKQTWLDIFTTVNTWTGTNTFTATTTFSGPVTIDGIIRTPNNKSDGSLNVTSGTVTLNDASHVSGDYAIYNYSTGTIAVGATLTTGANLKNKILVLRFTGTTTIAGTIDLSGKGAPGGALATNGTAGASTFAYSVGIKGSSSVSTPGAGGLSSDFALYDVWCGSGGGGGVSKGYAGGAGGDGGGSIILVTTGTLSFTGTLNISGIAGTSGSNEGYYTFLNADGGSGGGGGGGGKALFFAQYFNADATKYTITKTGGAGGQGSKYTGAAGGSPPVQAQASGAGGGASGSTAGSAGANGGTNNSPNGSQGAGGAGGDGAFYIGKIPPINLMQI